MDKTCRDSLRNNFAKMKGRLSGVEGQDYDIFWGGSETVIIDIAALGDTAVARAATNGSYYTKEIAAGFAYTKWEITTPAAAEYQSVVIGTGEGLRTKENGIANAVAVSTPQIELVPVSGTLRQTGKYVLMNAKYGYIMSFDATAAPEVAPGDQHGTSKTGSITLDADGNSENTYYLDDNGNVILDHSDRHFAIWNLYQYPCANKHNKFAAIPDGGLLDILNWSNFGPGTIYEGVELQKLTDTQNPYWHSLDYTNLPHGVSYNDYQLRYLAWRSISTPFKNNYRNTLMRDTDTAKNNHIIELLEDGSYVIYYKAGDDDFRFIYCDANGTWKVQQYSGSNAKELAAADMDHLKINLYEYKETDSKKRVAFSGSYEYYVNLDAAVEGIPQGISTGITVFDADRRNQVIPYNNSEITKTNYGGTESEITTIKEGYYWLDTSAVNTSASGEYPVAIKYRNDDGKDTTIGEVTVIVGKEKDYLSIENKSGTVTKNASLTTEVNVIRDDQFTAAVFSYQGENINICVGMLTDANGNPVNTANPGTYNNLVLTYNGVVICEDFTLTVTESNLALDYPVYPDEGSVRVDKSGKAVGKFNETGTAQITLSATAKPLNKGVDLIIIVDLSSSMRYHVNNSSYACGPMYNTDGTLNTKKAEDYTDQAKQLQYVYNKEWWTHTRMYAMEEALKEMVGTLATSGANVRIALADFGDLDHYEFEGAVLDDTIGSPAGSKPYWDADGNGTGTLEWEFSNHLNFIQGRDDTTQQNAGTPRLSQPYWLDQTKHNINSKDYPYTGKVLPKIYTGSGKLDSGAFQSVGELNVEMDSIINQMRVMNGKRLGTNYDIGLETLTAWPMPASRRTSPMVRIVKSFAFSCPTARLCSLTICPAEARRRHGPSASSARPTRFWMLITSPISM